MEYAMKEYDPSVPVMETERLAIRKFTLEDAEALFELLKDEEVNCFLPWFPVKSIEETLPHLDRGSFYYAICLKEENIPIGYIHVSENDSYDLGYGLKKEFWHRGYVTEGCRAVIELLKSSGIPYITATHDVNNPKSGAVMKRLGMVYKYSYEEQVQPKDMLVTFRMYQLNLDGQQDRVYRNYWEQSSVHFVEPDI